MKTKILVVALLSTSAIQAQAQDAGGSMWGNLLGAAVSVATQRAGMPVDASTAQQAAAMAQATVAANAAIGTDPKLIQTNLGAALAAQAAANGQTLTPAQQQAVANAYAQAAANGYGQSAVLTTAQQQALIKQGLTPAQLQALAQMQTLTPEQAQALAQARVASMTPAERKQYETAKAQAQAAQAQQALARAQAAQVSAANQPCQPSAQSKTGGFGGMLGKMAGGMLRTAGGEAGSVAAGLAESAGAAADCIPGK